MKRIPFNDNWIFNRNIVKLPHDAMLRGARLPEAPSGSAGAFFEGGAYVYEKTFARPEGKHVLFEFEGVYKNSKVYINGQEAGGRAYGYIPFFVNADPYLKDGENVIRVECENKDQPDSRWYSGAGIYRPVWLLTGPEDSIEPESVRVSTVSVNPAVIRVQSKTPVSFSLGDISGSGTDFELTVPGAKLWSAETPNLYTAAVSNGEDGMSVTFGIRTIEASPKGLFINGESTLLKGGCLHHDSGILGAATYYESEYRRVRKLKEAGFNAIRSAHNPASRALLDACDELGMYVMDETWDMWYNHKSKYDYASLWRENYIADIDSMVNRDFNHPSVICYSIGNEVSEPAKEEGIEKTREMAAHIHEIDPTRPVTGGFNLMIIKMSSGGKGIYDEGGGGMNVDTNKGNGMNSTLFNFLASMVGTGMNKAANGKKADLATSPSLDLLDIAGYNYASGRYPKEGKLHPDRVILGSETFPQDIAKNWAMVEKYPYLVGDFMWTAWDYIGEAGIGAWTYEADGRGFNKPYPWLLGDTGAFDILGNPNGELFLASAVWGALKKPAICVRPVNHKGQKLAKAVWRGTNSIPSWSWAGCGGERAVVEVYTDAARVSLMLNGKNIGNAKTKACRAVFKVKYEPGELAAAALDAKGREIARTVLSSAGTRTHITIKPEKESAKPGEIIYVPVVIADENGVVESNADKKIRVSVENGELLGFGSANPRTEERFDSGEYTTYYGRALAVIRAGIQGEVIVTAEGENETAKTAVPIERT